MKVINIDREKKYPHTIINYKQILPQIETIILNYCNKNLSRYKVTIECGGFREQQNIFLYVNFVNNKNKGMALCIVNGLNGFLDSHLSKKSFYYFNSNQINQTEIEVYIQTCFDIYEQKKEKTNKKRNNRGELQNKLNTLFETSTFHQNLKISADVTRVELLLENYKVIASYYGNADSEVEILAQRFINREFDEYLLKSISLMKKIKEAQKIMCEFLTDMNN